jgi:hypothetical protein
VRQLLAIEVMNTESEEATAAVNPTDQTFESVLNCIISSHYLATTSEQTEDFVCAAVVSNIEMCDVSVVEHSDASDFIGNILIEIFSHIFIFGCKIYSYYSFCKHSM